jgi:hypothetical protein
VSEDKNQGEGNREAAREYNQQQQEFVRDEERVRRQADEAEKALEGGERESLERAEREGKRHAKDEDPEIAHPGHGSKKD